jgi:UDP-glucose 4-epimerase
VREQSRLEEALKAYSCQAVVHFAGLKAVGESVEKPLDYYDNNVIGSHRLLRAMLATGVKSLVFSSSATVYGDPQFLPYTEDHPLAPTNPYGRTKFMVEEMLRDLHRAEPDWKIAILRYFNPVGAHESGRIGEDPRGIPNNLMPFVAQVAVGRRERLNVWGNDYPTPDGTGVRDYIHVMDLAEGHLRALHRLDQPCCLALNLGTGQGYSVLDLVKAFEQASGRHVPLSFAPRRPGDLASYYADPTLAATTLGWQATRDLAAMCADQWRWQEGNPHGYSAG